MKLFLTTYYERLAIAFILSGWFIYATLLAIWRSL
jgi:hypothetical protein